MTKEQESIEAAREAFIVDGVETADIRPETMAAWRRCKAAGVAATGSPVGRIDKEWDQESSLLRAVSPISVRLIRELQDSELAMMLVDRDAQIVGRWINGSRMEQHLDRMGVLPGAIFDESYVGSTGLGTALEEGVPSIVDGAEHYNNSFDPVVAVGAPIIHPGTGVVEGVIDVVALTGAPVGLMMPLISNAAREAGERLVTGYALEDRELLDSFLQIERRAVRRPMIAINSRLMFANHSAGSLLSRQPHAILWEDVQRAITDGLDSVLLGDPQSSSALLARIRTVGSGAGSMGAVLHIVPATDGGTAKRLPASPSRSLSSVITAKLPGRSLRWAGAVNAIADALVKGRPITLTGPVGSGKSALARTSALTWANDESRVTICDHAGADTLSSLLAMTTRPSVVVLDEFDDSLDVLGPLIEWAQSVPSEPVRLIFALGGDALAEVGSGMAGCTEVIEVPSLAYRATDIGDLIQAWAARRDDGGCGVDAEAVRELIRRKWPGNVRQLFWVLDTAASNRQGLTVQRQDLPSMSGVAPRERLTYLENVEREAISKLLEASGGGKMEVARELGVSRSTLYRKLAALGLDE